MLQRAVPAPVVVASLKCNRVLAEVGVPHVVAVETDSQVTDVAARSFTRAFYLALAMGKTVKGSFDIAQQAVSTSPQASSRAPWS